MINMTINIPRQKNEERGLFVVSHLSTPKRSSVGFVRDWYMQYRLRFPWRRYSSIRAKMIFYLIDWLIDWLIGFYFILQDEKHIIINTCTLTQKYTFSKASCVTGATDIKKWNGWPVNPLKAYIRGLTSWSKLYLYFRWLSRNNYK